MVICIYELDTLNSSGATKLQIGFAGYLLRNQMDRNHFRSLGRIAEMVVSPGEVVIGKYSSSLFLNGSALSAARLIFHAIYAFSPDLSLTLYCLPLTYGRH